LFQEIDCISFDGLLGLYSSKAKARGFLVYFLEKKKDELLSNVSGIKNKIISYEDCIKQIKLNNQL
jgi:hypothetical protein